MFRGLLGALTPDPSSLTPWCAPLPCTHLSNRGGGAAHPRAQAACLDPATEELHFGTALGVCRGKKAFQGPALITPARPTALLSQGMPLLPVLLDHTPAP